MLCPAIKNRLLSEVSTFGVGGPADLVEVRTLDEMQEILRYCRHENLRYMILGKGSNTLFDDRGFPGLVILNKIDFCEQQILPDNSATFHVGAGYSFSLLGTQTARQGFGGLEFASGIPASVGGAVWMNAGANGTETCSALTSVEFIDETGELRLFRKEELTFSYRHSPFQKMAGAIVGATFTLHPLPTARQRQLEIINYRKGTQPLSEMSAGCIFRNPDCGHAGALIEKSQLKGMAIGGAQVSTLHANFIINKGDASSKQVRALIAHVKEQVHQQTGVLLQSEVLYIPYDSEGDDILSC